MAGDLRKATSRRVEIVADADARVTVVNTGPDAATYYPDNESSSGTALAVGESVTLTQTRWFGSAGKAILRVTPLAASVESSVDEDLLRIDAAGLAEIAAAVAASRGRWETYKEEVFSDATGWTQSISNGIAAASGQFYNDTGVAGTPKFAYKLFADGALEPGETAVIVAQLVLPASGGSGGGYFGIVNSATPDTTDWFENSLMYGSSSALAPFRQGGAANSGTNDASGPTVYVPMVAGTYVVSIVIDEHTITLGLLSASGAQHNHSRVARTAEAGSKLGLAASAIFDGDIHGISMLMNDSRGSSGAKLQAITVRRGILAPKTTSAGGRATVSGPSLWHSAISVNALLDDPFTCAIPDGWNGIDELPLIVHLHGSSNTELNLYFGTSAALAADHSAVTHALVDAGYAVICPYLGSQTHWSNDFALKAVAAHIRHLRQHLPIGKIGVLGFSMGALTGANMVANREIGNIVALAGMYPAFDMAAAYAGGFSTPINAAYNIPGGGTYAAQTAGHDPMLRDADLFRGVPVWLAASPDDTAILKTQHADAFAAKLADTNDVTVVTASGPHGDPTHFAAAVAQLPAFFNAAFAAA